MSAQPQTRQRPRLDEYLVERGHFASRSRARDAVERGAVTVDGAVAGKAGQRVDEAAAIVIHDAARAFVSRAALKLIAGLDAFGIDPAGTTCLDVGASTGGFTQVMLERGAVRVIAVDVGHGQLHPRLANDDRVINIEKLNARDLTDAELGGRSPGLVVCDVSFISLKLALPPALALAADGASCVLLVKPQFEAGREAIGKGGIVRNQALGTRIASDMARWLDTQAGWRALGTVVSPVEGGDGNREYLLAGVKDR